MSLPEYSWMSYQSTPPARWDLRHLGWGMGADHSCETADGRAPVLLNWREDTRPLDWTSIRRPETVVVVGVDDPKARAGLLGAGFGDALDTQVALVELAARLVKLEAFSRSMPRKRKAGPVTLDLFYRDGRVDGSWLGLHPREFALLWRLAETPYSPVSRRQLIADVWRMDHLPETNSLEVHVPRLRAKLAISCCGWLVQTHPDGGLSAWRRRPWRVSGICGRAARNAGQGRNLRQRWSRRHIRRRNPSCRPANAFRLILAQMAWRRCALIAPTR